MADSYRKNAGIVVFRADKKVLVCKRIGASGTKCWQFPQGGIEPKETPLEAAYRELKEETGLSSVKEVFHLDEPIAYDYPPDVLESMKKKGFDDIGQAQYWTLFYFSGSDNEIDFCTNPKEIEFSDYQWIDIRQAPYLVWEPKKAAYAEMVSKFAPVIECFVNV